MAKKTSKWLLDSVNRMLERDPFVTGADIVNPVQPPQRVISWFDKNAAKKRAEWERMIKENPLA